MKLKFIIDKKYDKDMVLGMGYSKRLLKYVNSQYKTSLKFLKLAQKAYQKSWNEINNNFYEYIEKGIKLIKKYPNMGPKGMHRKPGNIFDRGIKK